MKAKEIEDWFNDCKNKSNTEIYQHFVDQLIEIATCYPNTDYISDSTNRREIAAELYGGWSGECENHLNCFHKFFNENEIAKSKN